MASHLKSILASELFAMSQGGSCQGTEECHWCGAPCERLFTHSDPYPIPFVRTKSPAKRPGNPYICTGCWLYLRGRVTVSFLGGGFKDGQCAANHSWWITETEAYAIRKEGAETLYEQLFHPPLRFVLALVSSGTINHIQHAVLNDHSEIRADTTLTFTYDHSPHHFTIYELKEALKTSGMSGKPAGVRKLIELFGPYDINEQPEKRGRGRPRKYQDEPSGKNTHQLIRPMSGHILSSA